jgi:riboflavin biosynthesis pyrimidine reductase
MHRGTKIADPFAPYAEVDRTRPEGGCWVIANMVSSLGGSAAIGGRVAELSTAPDAELVTSMRSLADVVLVGAQTIRAEGYGSLGLSSERSAARLAAGRPGTPSLAVVSRSLALDWSSSAFTAASPGSKTMILTCASADSSRLERARQVADVIIAGHDRVEPERGVRCLAELGHRIVLCEGGPTWLGEMAAAGQIDELCLTIAPMLGGDPLPIAVSPPGAPLRHFSLRHVMHAGDTLFLRYERGHA